MQTIDLDSFKEQLIEAIEDNSLAALVHQGKSLKNWEKEFKGEFTIPQLARMAKSGTDLQRLLLTINGDITIDEGEAENYILKVSREIKDKYPTLFMQYTISKNILGYACLQLQDLKKRTTDRRVLDNIKKLEHIFYDLQSIDIKRLADSSEDEIRLTQRK